MLVVAKFGGSVLRSHKTISLVLKKISEYRDEKIELITVFSAFFGITDLLKKASSVASCRDKNYILIYGEIKSLHISMCNEMLVSPSIIEEDLNLLLKLLNELYESGSLIAASCEHIACLGEVMSTKIIAKYIGARYVDAREMIVVDSPGSVDIDFARLSVLNKKIVNNCSDLVCITGYIASDKLGKPVTLGRGGSDYTATLIASYAGADRIDLWKDVDGLYSADPKFNKYAKKVFNVDYKEMMSLSHFGNRVVHKTSILPAMKKNIPICIRGIYSTDNAWTLIHRSHNDSLNIKKRAIGVSCEKRVSLIKITSRKYFNDAHRFLSGLIIDNKALSMVVSSSCNSISVAVKHADSANAVSELRNVALKNAKADDFNLIVMPSKCMISVVFEIGFSITDLMTKIAMDIQSVDVEIYEISHSVLENSISVVVDEANAIKVINKLNISEHDKRQKMKKTISIFINGNDHFYQKVKDIELDLFKIKFFSLKNISNISIFKGTTNEKLLIDFEKNTPIPLYDNLIKMGINLAVASNESVYKNREKIENEFLLNGLFVDFSLSPIYGIFLDIKKAYNILPEELERIIISPDLILSKAIARFDENILFSELVNKLYDNYGYSDDDKKRDLSFYSVDQEVELIMRDVGRPEKIKVINQTFFNGEISNKHDQLMLDMFLSAKSKLRGLRLIYEIDINNSVVYIKTEAVSRENDLFFTGINNELVIFAEKKNGSKFFMKSAESQEDALERRMRSLIQEKLS